VYSSRWLGLKITITLLACGLVSTTAASQKPILVSTPTSTRAIALEAVNLTSEPFSPRPSSSLYGLGQSTRIIVFVLNLSLQPNEGLSAVTAYAEDADHRNYDLAVEYVGKISGQEWLTAAILKLDQNMGDVGDVLIKIRYQGIDSNRVRVAIGHVGGGLADDPGSGPTPVPPYVLKGQITLGGLAFTGVTVELRGLSTASVTTNSNGAFAFIVTSPGDYTLTPAKRFFTFTPSAILLPDLANSRTVNFSAVRDTFTINGFAEDDQGSGVDGVSVKLESNGGGLTKSTTSANGGKFLFTDLPAGFDYTITPTNTSLFAFTPQNVSELVQNLALTFKGVRRTYAINGTITDELHNGVSGAAVVLSGATSSAVTTDANGRYSFDNLFAGRDYTVTASKRFFTVTPTSIPVTNLSSPVTASFTAVRDNWTIAGTVKDDQAQGLNGVLVSLESNESGATVRTTTTSNGGNFLFNNVRAGFNYSITPSTTNVFLFASQSVTEFNQNLTLMFSGNRRTYTISGFVRDQAQRGLSGVAITLSGAANRSATSDANGNYSFDNLFAGRDYTVTASKRFFTVTPTSIPVTNLSSPVTASFTAVRDNWTIAGTVKNDQAQGLNGVLVSLESNESGATVRTTTTSNGGNFLFNNVRAGFNYSTRPTNTSLYAFTQQTVNELSQNVTVNFNGVRRTYTISGFISDKAQHGVNGVNVTLSGAAARTETTDANGNYSFTGLLAGGSYSVYATKPNHYINPASRGFNLLRDETANFSAIRFYEINGRVADNSNRGLNQILMSLSGPESLSARTGNDGRYSFIVTTSGNYLLTPSREQDFYQFSPANRSLLNLNDHVTANFTAPVVVTSPTYVLEFDGTPMAVDYGVFWPTNTNVGQFFWELWAMPSTNNLARYMISDGYGGAHTILFGFNDGGSGRYALTGNVWTGASHTFSFSSDDGPSVGEWGHYAVGWDGNSIITYYNGVPVGKQAFTGPRVSSGPQDGANKLFVGGSTHQNFNGRIAQLRGYEENNPRAGAPESAFAPQTIFSVDGQFLSYYFRPNPVVVDLSFGYNGKQHDGWLRNMRNYFTGCPGCPVPKYVMDPTAPDFGNADNPGQTNTLIAQPGAPPDGARIFDSFSRNNSTYILNGKGGLGTSETGSGVWQTNVDANLPQPFGILAGRAVVLANTETLTWIPITTTTGNVDVRVDRKPGNFGSGANTGICFRVVDKNNFFFAFTRNDAANSSGPKKLTLGHYQSGLRTVLIDDVAMPATWTTLRVVTSGSGAITIYANATLVYSTSDVLNSFAGGAGLFNQGPGMGLQNRWDNFTILDVP
jgi:hypothetical protein